MVRPCTYICSEGCSYAQHQSCEMLSASPELQSLFHPPHTLTIHRQLRDDINLMCDACREEYCDFTRLIFRCDECNFQLDMDCALMSQVKLNEGEEEEEVHTHPNHQHPLLLHENMPGKLIFYCPVCGDYFLNRDTAYGCIPCLFFIHKSCFERKLPLEIQHFYQSHLLSISTNESNQGITYKLCKACCEHLSKPPKFWY